ncbi:MAG TPA: hypothetical protein VIK11_10240 [Tepidiformaceae bacterium]
MKRIPRTALVAAGLVAMASIVGGGIVFAQTSGSSSPLGNVAALTAQAGPGSNESVYIAQLAANLHLDVPTVQAAISTTNLSVLNSAVAAGKITQAQADKIQAALGAGNGFFFGSQGPKNPGTPGITGRGGFFGTIGDVEGSVATFLKITPAQLKTELQGGESLADVATAHGQNRDSLKSFLTTQVTTEIGKAVTDGKLLPPQADLIKSTLSSHLDQIIDAKPGSMMPQLPQRSSGSGTAPANPGSPRGGSRQPSGTTPSGLN